MKDNSVFLGEISETRDGIIQSRVGNELFIKNKIDEDSKKILFGEDINQYQIKYSGNWVNYKPDKMKELESLRNNGLLNLRLRKKEIFERKKILTRQTSDKIIAAYDEDCYYYANTLHGTFIINDNYSPLYLLAVLNSKIITWYYRKTTDEEGKVFAQIKIKLLRELPIPKVNRNNKIKIEKLVSEILVIDNKNDSTIYQHMIAKIDNMVYKLYELTYDEVKVIDTEFALSQEEYENYEVEE